MAADLRHKTCPCAYVRSSQLSLRCGDSPFLSGKTPKNNHSFLSRSCTFWKFFSASISYTATKLTQKERDDFWSTNTDWKSTAHACCRPWQQRQNLNATCELQAHTRNVQIWKMENSESVLSSPPAPLGMTICHDRCFPQQNATRDTMASQLSSAFC